MALPAVDVKSFGNASPQTFLSPFTVRQTSVILSRCPLSDWGINQRTILFLTVRADLRFMDIQTAA
jgi:hypothetical protein